jgi:hypothetical protein
MLPVNLHVLEEADHGGDDFTSSSVAQVQVGNVAWKWQKQLTFVRLHPHLVTEPRVVNRFRSVMLAWRPHYLPHNPVMFHVEPHGEPFAVFEYEGGRSLQAMFGALTQTAPLGRDTAEKIVDAVYRGLAARHELGFAHGALGLDRIMITQAGVSLGIGMPWDPSANRDDDLRRADRVRQELIARTRPPTPPGSWLALGVRRST